MLPPKRDILTRSLKVVESNNKKSKDMAYKPITKRANGMITPPKKTTGTATGPAPKKMTGPGGPSSAPVKGATGTTKPTYIYIIGEEGKQNREVSKSVYDKWKGPKTTMKADDPNLKNLPAGGRSTGVKTGYIKKN